MGDEEYIEKLKKCFFVLVAGLIIVFGFNAYFPVAAVLFVLLILVGCYVYLKDNRNNTVPVVKTLQDIVSGEDIKLWMNLPLPIVVINQSNKMISSNESFKNLWQVSDENELKYFVQGLDTHINKHFLNIDGNTFEIYCSKIENTFDRKDIYSLCFVDVTEKEKMKARLEHQRTVSGFIYVDNYDEATEGIDDYQKPLLSVMIDKKLSSYIAEFGGIIRRFEEDRYLFVISYEGLEKIKERKFDILTSIKEVKEGNNIPVTLSIGIGANYGSLASTLKTSKDAIDLALGRGGDQALIKDGDKHWFFGGKSSQGSHNAKIRARVKADALKSLIDEAESVFVMGHKNPDLDAMGACIGIYRISKDLRKPCKIILSEPSKGIEALYNKITEQINHRDIFINEEEALDLMTSRTLVVIVDTYVPHLVESQYVLNKSKKTVVFDHHRKSTEFIENAVLTYHETFASSASELVTEVIRNINEKIQLKPIEADALLAGIMVDTKGFGIKAGAITFESAAFLRRQGADSDRIREFFKTEFNWAKVKAATIAESYIYKDVVMIGKCPYTEKGTNIICAQAADELLNVIDIKISVSLCKMDDDVHISARSTGEHNVQVLLEKLNGGGHRTMAGAQIKNVSLDEGEALLKNAIDEYLKEEE